MPYQVLEHTADYKLRVTGHDQPELFSAALQGMMSFLKSSWPERAKNSTRRISLSADNPTVLLIDFLSEALALSQINKEIYKKVIFSNLTEKKLIADLEGVAVDQFDDEIKAVTYHGACIHYNQEGLLETAILFDI